MYVFVRKRDREREKERVRERGSFFVAMNMVNRCAKFHKDSPSGKKVKFILPSAVELSETADYVYNYV